MQSFKRICEKAMLKNLAELREGFQFTIRNFMSYKFFEIFPKAIRKIPLDHCFISKTVKIVLV